MREKDTVVFITEGRSTSEKLIAEELSSDAAYLGVIVPADKLIPFGRIIRAKINRFLKLFVWRPISIILSKFTKRIKPVQTPVYYNALSKMRVHNMLFRFSPKAIVVSDPNTLYALKEILGRTAQKADLYVYGDNLGLDYGLADKEIKHFFVDNYVIRENLLKQGVFAEHITVEPLPVKKKYFEERAQIDSKRNLGFDEKTNLTLLCPNKKNYRKLLDFAETNGSLGSYAVLTDNADIQVYAESKKIVSFDKSVRNEEIFNASDVVISAYDGYLIKRVAARGKGTIVFGDCGAYADTAAVLEGEKHIKVVRSTEELGEALMQYYNHELVFVPDETSADSASKIAREITKLVKQDGKKAEE